MNHEAIWHSLLSFLTKVVKNTHIQHQPITEGQKTWELCQKVHQGAQFVAAADNHYNESTRRCR
jgi:hypothetical protein